MCGTPIAEAPKYIVKLLAALWEKASIDYLTGVITIGAAAFAYIQWQEEKDRSAKELASGLSVHWVTDWAKDQNPIPENERRYRNSANIKDQVWGILITNSTNTQFTNIEIEFQLPISHLIKVLNEETTSSTIIYSNPYIEVGNDCAFCSRDLIEVELKPLYKNDHIIDRVVLEFLPPGSYLIRLAIDPWPDQHHCGKTVVGLDFTEPKNRQLPPLTRSKKYAIRKVTYYDYNANPWSQENNTLKPKSKEIPHNKNEFIHNIFWIDKYKIVNTNRNGKPKEISIGANRFKTFSLADVSKPYGS